MVIQACSFVLFLLLFVMSINTRDYVVILSINGQTTVWSSLSPFECLGYKRLMYDPNICIVCSINI